MSHTSASSGSTSSLGSDRSDASTSFGRTAEQDRERKISRCPTEYTFQGRRYKVVKRLGAGASAVSFLCSEASRENGRTIAVLCKQNPEEHNQYFDARGNPRPRTDLSTIRYLIGQKVDSPPDYPCFFIENLGAEYVRSGRSRAGEAAKYYSVSYWPVYNGGTVGDWGYTKQTGSYIPPVSVVARMAAQVMGALQWLTHNQGSMLINHKDLHFGNLFMHFPGWDGENDRPFPPNFYIGDWELAQRIGLQARNRQYLADPATLSEMNDLSYFVENFNTLIIHLELGRDGSTEGVGQFPDGNPVWTRLDALNNAIRQLDDDISDQVLPPVPDYARLIQQAQDLEAFCGRGGEEDPIKYETASQVWFDFFRTRYHNAIRSCGRPAYPV